MDRFPKASTKEKPKVRTRRAVLGFLLAMVESKEAELSKEKARRVKARKVRRERTKVVALAKGKAVVRTGTPVEYAVNKVIGAMNARTGTVLRRS